MATRRYTILIADRSSGVLRRATVGLRSFLAGTASLLMIPVLIGLGAKLSTRAEIEQLHATNIRLRSENANYRAATGAFAEQIQSLENVIDGLGAGAASGAVSDPIPTMLTLPAVVKARAAGGSERDVSISTSAVGQPVSSPEKTFGVLRSLLQNLEGQLPYVRRAVERRESLAAATPSIWPAHGWLTGLYGIRRDPFTGEPGFHRGIDISTEAGQPVYATADGTIESASYADDYGNLLVLEHDFGLTTRYGHLSAFVVKPGARVKRGDVIGYVGATGRATGPHLHYEVLANGSLLNPLDLLTTPAARD